MREKVTSRKLWLTVVSVNIFFFGPLVYKALEVSDQVTLFALGAIGAVVSTYMGANVLQKKFQGHE